MSLKNVKVIYPNIKNIFWDLHVKFFAGRKCNLKCKYCEYFGDETVQDQDKFVKFFNELSKKHSILLEITGGEPTVNLNLFEFFEKLNSNINILLFTNLTPSYEYWKNISKLLNKKFKNFFVVSTLHYQIKDVNDFIKKMKLFKGHAKINCLSYPKNYRRCLKLYKELKDYDVKFQTLCIQPQKFCHKLTFINLKLLIDDKEQNEVFYETFDGEKKILLINDLMYFNESFKGFKCEAGRKFIIIDHFGKVYRCTKAFLLKDQMCDLDNFKLYDKDEICEYDECPCEYFTIKKYLK